MKISPGDMFYKLPCSGPRPTEAGLILIISIAKNQKSCAYIVFAGQNEMNFFTCRRAPISHDGATVSHWLARYAYVKVET
jgi:hypothetical protein